MHTLLGYSWGEIASILAVLSVLISFVYWLFSYSGKVFNRNIHTALEPFLKQLDNLNKTIEKMNINFTKQQSSFERLEKRVDEHDRRLDRHHERIKSLAVKEDK